MNLLNTTQVSDTEDSTDDRLCEGASESFDSTICILDSRLNAHLHSNP